MNNALSTVGQWVTKLGSGINSYFYGTAADSSNNFIAVGYEAGNSEALIAKFNTDGTLLWQKKLDGSIADTFNGITTDSSNNYIAAGYEVSVRGTNDVSLIAKFDTNGVLLWQKKLSGNDNYYFHSVTTDSSNNYVAAGYEFSAGALIAKFDTNGVLLWQKKLSGNGDQIFRSVTTDTNDNYISVGCKTSRSANYEALIAKFDTDGNLLWQKKQGSSSITSVFNGITTDSSNNYIAVGSEDNSVGSYEALIAKFDTDGNLLWRKKLGGSGDSFNGITTDSSNNYIAVGFEKSSTSGNDYEALIAKFDSDGNLLWQKKLCGGSHDRFNGVTTDSSNNYVAVGIEKSSTSDWKALIVKFDTNGTIAETVLESTQSTLSESLLTVTDSSLNFV